jgi:hypothetical protein
MMSGQRFSIPAPAVSFRTNVDLRAVWAKTGSRQFCEGLGLFSFASSLSTSALSRQTSS